MGFRIRNFTGKGLSRLVTWPGTRLVTGSIPAGQVTLSTFAASYRFRPLPLSEFQAAAGPETLNLLWLIQRMIEKR